RKGRFDSPLFSDFLVRDEAESLPWSEAKPLRLGMDVKILGDLVQEQQMVRAQAEAASPAAGGGSEPAGLPAFDFEMATGLEAREEAAAGMMARRGLVDFNGDLADRPMAGELSSLMTQYVIDGDYGRGEYFGRRIRRYDPTTMLVNLFPQLPAPVKKFERRHVPTWPEAARALSRSLLRTEKLAKLTGGIEVVQRHEYFDTRWGD